MIILARLWTGQSGRAYLLECGAHQRPQRSQEHWTALCAARHWAQTQCPPRRACVFLVHQLQAANEMGGITEELGVGDKLKIVGCGISQASESQETMPTFAASLRITAWQRPCTTRDLDSSLSGGQRRMSHVNPRKLTFPSSSSRQVLVVDEFGRGIV